MTIDCPQIVGTPTRSKSRDYLHDMRENATSNQAQNPLDQTLTCLHRHLEGDLGIISGFLLAAGTPALSRLLLTLLGRLAASALGCRLLGGLAAGTPAALRGGLLGATSLGCHADNNFCKDNREKMKLKNLNYAHKLLPPHPNFNFR